MPIAPLITSTQAELLIRVFPAAGEPVAAVLLLPLSEFGLGIFDEIAHTRLPPELASRGSARLEVIFAPDEPDLEMLCVAGDLLDGAPAGDQEWLLLSHPDDPAALHQKLISGAEIDPEWKRQITVRDEDELHSAWGRVLSVRERIRLLMGEGAGAAGVHSASAWLDPGHFAICLRLTNDLITAVEAGERPDVDADLLDVTLPDPKTLGFNGVMAGPLAYEGPEGWREWAGPYANALLEGEAALSHVLDLDRFIAAIAETARRHGLMTIEPTSHPAWPPPEEDEDKGEPGETDALNREFWFATPKRTPFYLTLDQCVMATVGRGLTIAEGAAHAVGRQAMLAYLCERVADEFSAETGLPVQILCPQRMLLGDDERGQLMANIESISAKMPQERIVGHLVDSIRNSALGGADRVNLDELSFSLHLRPREWIDTQLIKLDPLLVIPVRDASGVEDRFALCACLEDRANVMWLSKVLWQKMIDERSGDLDIEERIADGLERIVFEGWSEALEIGPDGIPDSVLVVSSNVPTALAHPTLTSGFLARLLADYGLRPPLVAMAPSTELVIILRGLDPRVDLLNAALAHARADKLDRTGTPLGFMLVVEEDPPEAPQGTFSITARNARPVGRNDPCPCGSGKKFKRCHGA